MDISACPPRPMAQNDGLSAAYLKPLMAVPLFYSYTTNISRMRPSSLGASQIFLRR